MKTANEMFNELEFYKIPYNKNYVVYEKKKKYNIIIDLKNNEISKNKYFFKKHNEHFGVWESCLAPFTIEELKCVMKWMEEHDY